MISITTFCSVTEFTSLEIFFDIMKGKSDMVVKILHSSSSGTIHFIVIGQLSVLTLVEILYVYVHLYRVSVSDEAGYKNGLTCHFQTN